MGGLLGTMLQEIVNNFKYIGLLLSFLLTLVSWIYQYRKNKKHPEFPKLFLDFSTYILIYNGVTSAIFSTYLILSPIFGLNFLVVTADNLKYTLIVGGLAILYLGISKVKNKEL